MQKSEKVDLKPPRSQSVFESPGMIQKVVNAALILFVPFWIESVQEMLKRIA